MAEVENFRRDVIMAAVSRDPQAKQQLQAIADRIADDARQLAPHKTGTLARSITVWDHYNPVTQATEYRVGWDRDIAFYGWMVEAGTENTHAQPHIRPAAIKNGGTAPRTGGV